MTVCPCVITEATHVAIKWFQNAGFLWITLLNMLNTWPLNLCNKWDGKWGTVTNLIHRLVLAVFWPNFYMHFSCFLCMIHDTPCYENLFDYSDNFDKDYKLQISSFHIFLQPPLAFSLLGPSILLNTPFPKNLCPCISFTVLKCQ